jgi:hypothetical protein
LIDQNDDCSSLNTKMTGWAKNYYWKRDFCFFFNVSELGKFILTCSSKFYLTFEFELLKHLRHRR